MGELHFLTVCNFAYLPQARLLLDSIDRFHSDSSLTLFLVEERSRSWEFDDILSKFHRVVFMDELLGHERFKFLFPYSVVEACTSVKAHAILHLLEEHRKLVYLDPDIVLFDRLTRSSGINDSCDIGVTPHLIDLSADVHRSINDEITTLKTGTFNLGFLYVRSSTESRRILKWWASRLQEHCLDNASRGLFTDQKWINLLSGASESISVLRHSGLNVASWNLHERTLTLGSDGKFLANGVPLIFIHFSKFPGFGVDQFIKKASNQAVAISIARWYAEQVRRLQRSFLSNRNFEWSYFRYVDTGSPITPIERSAVAETPWEARSNFPFAQK